MLKAFIENEIPQTFSNHEPTQWDRRDVADRLTKGLLEQPLLRQLMGSVRCEAIIGIDVVQRYRGLYPVDQVIQKIKDDECRIAEDSVFRFVRANGWGALPHPKRSHYAQCLLSLLWTANYTIVSKDDLSVLKCKLGAAEDCAEVGTDRSSTAGATTPAGLPPWAIGCYPPLSDEKCWVLSARARGRSRFRVDPAAAIVAFFILVGSIVPKGGGTLHEKHVATTTFALLRLRAIAARSKLENDAQSVDVPLSVLLPWVQGGNIPVGPTITFTQKTRVVFFGSDAHPASPNPLKEAKVIRSLLEEHCIVVEHADPMPPRMT